MTNSFETIPEGVAPQAENVSTPSLTTQLLSKGYPLETAGKLRYFIDLQKLKGLTQAQARSKFGDYLGFLGVQEVDDLFKWFNECWDDPFVHIDPPQEYRKYSEQYYGMLTPLRIENKELGAELSFVIKRNIPPVFYIETSVSEIESILEKGYPQEIQRYATGTKFHLTLEEAKGSSRFRHSDDIERNITKKFDRALRVLLAVDSSKINLANNFQVYRTNGSRPSGFYYMEDIPPAAISVVAVETTQGIYNV